MNNPSGPPGPGFHTNTLTVDGIERHYILYVPSAGLENGQVYPVVFLLHGHGGSKDILSGQNGTNSAFHAWKEVAELNSLILCYPDGTVGPDNATGWNDCRSDATKLPSQSDSKFLDKLIDLFINDYLGDAKRVYMCGVSNGGFMTMRMGIEHADKIAGLAIINAQMATHSECGQPATPLPILIMNGTADNLVPYDGGTIGPDSGTALSTDSTINLWVKLNDLPTTPAIHDFTNIEMDDHSTVVRELYSNGATGNEVCLYKVIGGGHAEPSIHHQYSSLFELLVGYQNHDIEMAHEVWEFFSSKSK